MTIDDYKKLQEAIEKGKNVVRRPKESNVVIKSSVTTIQIKPISVNDCWQGRRFKTPHYKDYEAEVLAKLPNFTMPEAPLTINLEFGFSNSVSDIDNPIKPTLDILQKKYKFNDKSIYELKVIKKVVKKGEEYFSFNIESLNK
jgi:Holliday junction resolvase RusA-like endonuclease